MRRLWFRFLSGAQKHFAEFAINIEYSAWLKRFFEAHCRVKSIGVVQDNPSANCARHGVFCPQSAVEWNDINFVIRTENIYKGNQYLQRRGSARHVFTA